MNDPDPLDLPAQPDVDHSRLHLRERYERLERSRSVGPLVAVGKRFFEIDGLTQAGLLAIELFTTIIPLIILGFGYLTGFAANASLGNLFVRVFALDGAEAAQVQSAFGTSSALASTWTFFGVMGFLVWGIPMSITVAAMFAKAWRREQFSIGARLWRGALWFVAYLAMLLLRVPVTGADRAGLQRLEFAVVSLVVVWIFWSLSPVLLVRDGGRGWRSFVLAGLAGTVVDGVILPLAGRIAFPILLSGWTGFGPIGVAMTLMTWCGVLSTGWVVTACAGAVLWERDAPTDVVLDAQTKDTPAPI